MSDLGEIAPVFVSEGNLNTEIGEISPDRVNRTAGIRERSPMVLILPCNRQDLRRAILDPHRPCMLADWGPPATVGLTARP
jgi:hypothetical protein